MRPFLGVVAATVFVLGLGSLPARADDVPHEARAAFVKLRQGDARAALSASERAVRLHELSSGAWRVRAFILSSAGDQRRAIAAYARALKLNPADAISHNNLGTLLLALGDLEDALHAFDAALELKPGYADALNNRGAALERLRRFREAEQAYGAAATAAPEHATAHNNLGAARLRRGDRAGAEAAFRRSAALDPRLDAPALNLAMLRDPTLTDETAYQRLLQSAARPGAGRALKVRALSARAARAGDAGQWKQARTLYLEALALAPTDVNLLNNVAVVEDQLELDRNALLHLGEALRLRPQFDVARNNLGIVHVHRGDATRAKDAFRTILKRNPRFHRAHYNLGVILASEGELAQARASFRRAAVLAPRDASVRYNLGLLARESGAGLEVEMRAYTEALSLEEGLAEAHLAMGGLLADPDTPPTMRDYAKARRHLQRFLELAPAGDDEGRAQAREWLAYLAQRN